MRKITVPLVAGPLLFVVDFLVSTDLYSHWMCCHFGGMPVQALYSDIPVCIGNGVPETPNVLIFVC